MTGQGWRVGVRRGWWAAALLVMALMPGEAAAQFRSTVSPPASQFAPSTAPALPSSAPALPSSAPALPSSPGASLLPPETAPIPPGSIPGIPAAPPPAPPQPLAPQSLAPPAPGPTAAPVPVPLPAPGPAPAASLPAGQVALAVSARYARESQQAINGGLLWRIYPVKPDQSGAFRPIKEDKTASPTFSLPPGDYVVHVSFGLASAAKAVRLRSETLREVLDLPAGGLRMEGRVGDVRIPASQISFDVFKGSQFEPGEKQAVAQGVITGDVVMVPEGTYHIVSNYGDSNSVVRSDIRVQAGRLTDVTVTHRAAVIMLKLVGERGGEALANTSWSVLTKGGDVIKESIGAFPKVVLAEGDYLAIARNDDKTYERSFKVITGVDGEIEVMAH
jgi:hypothetical protein